MSWVSTKRWCWRLRDCCARSRSERLSGFSLREKSQKTIPQNHANIYGILIDIYGINEEGWPRTFLGEGIHSLRGTCSGIHPVVSIDFFRKCAGNRGFLADLLRKITASLDDCRIDEFHDPAVDILEGQCWQLIAERVLANGDVKAGNVQQF